MLTADDVFDLQVVNLPGIFDVVWCHYPYNKATKAPGPDARPCIVRQSFTRATQIKGENHTVGYVEVIYGTKQVDKFHPPRGFHVDDVEEKSLCGLYEDTVFDLTDRIILPWSPIYFSTKKGAPVSGTLNEDMRARLIDQNSRIDWSKSA